MAEYTEQQLFQKLRAADAAGNEEDARAIAGMIRRLRASNAEPERAAGGPAVPYRSQARTSFAQGLPFIGPLSDEIIAGVGAIPGAIQTGQSVPEAYSGILDRVRGNTERYRAENPGRSLAIELGTSLAVPGGGALNTATMGASRGANVAKSVGANALLGAGSGVAASDRGSVEETLGDAAMGAGFGLLGAAADLPRALRAPTMAAQGAGRRAAGTAASRAVAGPAARSGGQQQGQRVVAAADRGGFPLTPGEVRARDTDMRDIGGMREEIAARRGLLGDDAEQGMAAAESARDRYVLDTLVDNGTLSPASTGELSQEAQDALLAGVSRLDTARRQAYDELSEFQPFVERDSMARMASGAREALLDPPDSAGFKAAMGEAELRRRPLVREAYDYLEEKLGQYTPASGAVAGPGGPGKFGLGEVEQMRRTLRAIASQATPGDDDARLINQAVRRLDEIEGDLFDGGAIRSSEGSADAFRAARAQARQAHGRYMDAVAGKNVAGRRQKAKQVTKLVENLQAGNVKPETAVDQILATTGKPQAGAPELLAQVDEIAPASGSMLRMAAARRLFGSALDVSEDGSLRIQDRRALLGRLEKAVEADAGLLDDIMGQGWTQRAKRLLSESKPSREDIGRSGNRFDPLNPSGSGSQANLYRHLYSGMRALATQMYRTGVLAPAAGALNAAAEGMRTVGEQAVGSRVVRGVLDATEPSAATLPEEFVTQWKALVPGAVSTSVSGSGGQAVAAEREPSLL